MLSDCETTDQLVLSQDARIRQTKGGKSSQPQVSTVFAVLVLLVCCGLPFLIITGGGLASLSLITGRYRLLFAGAAIAVLLLAVVGIALRSGRNKNSSRKTKTNREARA